MRAAQRQVQILDEVQHRGSVRVSELSELLGVSDMTIRRDLDRLASQRRLVKVHGGATAKKAPSTDEPGFVAKGSLQTAEKEAIADLAASLINPGSAIGLSAGTTTWTLAHRLREMSGLTVVTNSIRIADLLYGAGPGAPDVIVTGGVRTPSDALVGPIAVSSIAQLHLDIVFLGVHGMDRRAGFTTPNLLEAETNRALVRAANRLVVVADHTKWGTIGISTIASLSEADAVVTDVGLTHASRVDLHDQGVELLVAPVAR